MKTVIDLNGKWKFAPTHDQKPTNHHMVVESKIPFYALPELVRTDWETVTVPGVWEKYAEKYSVYEGVCWFYREFKLDDISDSTCARIVFKGVNYKADVYVNGKAVGVHESGYTEFFFDISDFVHSGINSVAVCVDNRPIIVKWPNDWGYGVYGGIHRDVFVEIYENSFLNDISLTPDYDVNSGKGILYIKGKAHVNSENGISVKLGNSDSKVICQNEEFCARLEYENVVPWTPENPALYDFAVMLDGETYKSCKIGFRNIRCEKRKLFLNGNEIKIYGACYVYDSPVYGLVMDRETLAGDLIKMKEANVNAVRTHYPMSDDFYELCDEMGFMVWIEPNVYCSDPPLDAVDTVFKQKDFVDVAVSMTEEMIIGGRQYASVIIYGIGNECKTSHPEAHSFFVRLRDAVRASDNSRLIGYASLYGQIEGVEDIVDVMGINTYYGWYDVFDMFKVCDDIKKDGDSVKIRKADVSPLHELIDKTEKALPKDTAIILTEFGADSIPGYYSSVNELWSENYHAEVIKKTVAESKKHESVAGTFVFAFIDYPDPSKPLNGRWNGYNLKGMLTNNREYKLPFYALQEVYGFSEGEEE